MADIIRQKLARDPTGGREQSFSQAIRDTRRDTLLEVAEAWANIYAHTNPRFHRERFLTACGFDVPYTDPPAPSWQGEALGPGRGKRRAFVPLSERQARARDPGV